MLTNLLMYKYTIKFRNNYKCITFLIQKKYNFLYKIKRVMLQIFLQHCYKLLK